MDVGILEEALRARAHHAGDAVHAVLAGACASQDANIAAGLKAQGKLMADLATASEKVVANRDESLNISEKQGSLDKLSQEAAQRRTSIDEAALKFKLDLFDPKSQVTPQDRDKLIKQSVDSASRLKFAVSADEATSLAEVQKKFATPFDPGPLRVGTDPVPGGRRAGIGESQELVNQIELNRQGRNSSSLRLPWHYNPDTGDSSIDQWGFKRTENSGAGIDGIKSGIDAMKQHLAEIKAWIQSNLSVA